MKASPYLELANELEITKAVTYLKEKDLAKVRILSLPVFHGHTLDYEMAELANKACSAKLSEIIWYPASAREVIVLLKTPPNI